MGYPTIPVNEITAPSEATSFEPSLSGFPIWVLGTDVLKEHAAEIPFEAWGPDKVFNLARLLGDTLNHWGGDGLAATQVGVPWQMFIVKTSVFQALPDAAPFPIQVPAPTLSGDTYQILINPVLSNETGSWKSEEQCLSIPGYYTKKGRAEIRTTRYEEFDLKYYTLTFKVVGEQVVPEKIIAQHYHSACTQPSCQPFPSENKVNWVLQHERDHLFGIMFTDISTGGEDSINKAYLTGVRAGLYGGVYNPQ